MENYVVLNGEKTALEADQITKIRGILTQPRMRLGELEPSSVFRIGEHELFVLEQGEGVTMVIFKELLPKMAFGKNNRYDGSAVDDACCEIARKLALAVGEETLVEHTVDLTSDDGLKDYGTIRRYVSLLTAEQYRKYVYVLDRHKPEAWWWLATPYSTDAHEDDRWVKCVSPSGLISDGGYGLNGGVRPFCIFKSDIFVSQ